MSPSPSPVTAQVNAALPWSWLRLEVVSTTTTYAVSSADSDSTTPRTPRLRPAVNGGTAIAPRMAVVECDDRPATDPTISASTTRISVAGSPSSSAAVTAAQIAAVASRARSSSWLFLTISGMTRLRSANVRAPTASQVCCRPALPQIIGRRSPRPRERVHDVDDGRAHDRDEQAREDAEDQGHGDLHRHLLGLLLRTLTPLHPDLRGLDAQ